MKLSITGTQALNRLAGEISRFPAQAQAAGTEAVNDVAAQVITRAARDLTQRYNLQASYIRDKLRIIKASRGGDAYVVARHRATRLFRFDGRQLTAPAPRAKGDPRRKIGAGRKQAGVSVRVRRDEPRDDFTRHVFLLPLRAGKQEGGNGWGMFERHGPGERDITHLYGPSPDQAFSWWAKHHAKDIGAALDKAFTARFARQRARGRS